MRKLFHQIGLVLIILTSLPAFAIIKGDLVPSSQQTETVYISTDPSDLTKESCTGVIVAPNLVLTAGHCIDEIGRTTGKLSISNAASREFPEEVWVEKMKTHPRYVHEAKKRKSENFQYDIGYILLKDNLSKTLKPVLFPLIPGSRSEALAALATQNVWAVGYGFSANVILPANKTNMRKRELSLSSEGETEDNYFVMKSNSPGKGICEGDSGGGLFVRTAQGNSLVGILSGASSYLPGNIELPRDCGNSKMVAVYVSLYHHLCWLKQETGLSLSTNVSCN